MKLRNLYLVVTFGLVTIGMCNANSLQDQLPKLQLLSRFLNTTAVRNGFNSGYPSVYDYMVETLELPSRHLFLKFLNLDVWSLPSDLSQYYQSIQNLTNVTVENSEDFLNFMWNIVEMKKYKERFEGDFIDKIENSQETVIRIRNELMKIPSSTNSDELLNLLKPMVKTDKIPDDLDRKVNYLVTDLDKISRSDFSDYFSLKKALGTWRLLLELSKTFKGMSGKWDTVLKNLEVIKSKFSDMKESSSAHRRHFNMPVILRSLLLIADQMKATPKEHRILPTQFSDSDMENDWFRFDLLQSQQLFPLEEMIETIRKMEKIVSDVYPNWKETSKILGTEEEIIDSIENTQKYGDQIRVLNISEAEMNATIECISSLDFDNIVILPFDEHDKRLKKIEEPLETIGKLIEEMLLGTDFKKVRSFLNQLDEILKDTKMEEKEKMDKIFQLKAALIEVLPKITATLNFNRDAAPKMPSINKAVLEALFEQLTSMIEKSNILKVYGCISQSVMYKLERVIRFLNSANGSMKNGFLDNVANLCSVRFNLSKAIEEAESSEQLEFQGIQFINRMAEEFSLGVHGLEYLQKVTENLTVIQGVIKNQSESFNQTQKVKNLISDIENLNGTEFHLNSTDSWKMVFIEAAKIKNKAFEITEEDLKMNFHLPVHDAMTNTNVIVSDFNIHLENIRVASGIADNVQKLIHSVFYQKEVTKGNSLKEGINQGFSTEYHTPWYMYIVIYPYELIIFVALLLIPTAFLLVSQYFRNHRNRFC